MRPDLLQTISQLLVLAGVVMTALGGFGTYYFGKRVEQAKEEHAAASEEALRGQLGELLKGNRALEAQLAPFEELAKKVYPAVERDAALAHLLQEFEALDQRAAALEAGAKPRRLPAGHGRQRFIAALGPNTGSVTLTATLGDGEAMQFAQDLKAALTEAGWVVNGVNQAVFTGSVQGVILAVGADPPNPLVHPLYKALRSVVAGVQGQVKEQLPQDGIEIILGKKP